MSEFPESLEDLAKKFRRSVYRLRYDNDINKYFTHMAGAKQATHHLHVIASDAEDAFKRAFPAVPEQPAEITRITQIGGILLI